MILLAIAAVWLAAEPGGRRFTRSALTTIDLMAPLPLGALRLIGPEPASTLVTIPYRGGSTQARFYRPYDGGRDGGAAGADPGREPVAATAPAGHGALILAPGYPSNINDPQLGRLASDMARAGLAVLIPRLAGLRNGDISAGDVEALVGSYQWLAGQPAIDARHIGFAGFCVGSSLALLASEDPRINEQVAMINTFGGYYDLLSFLRAAAAHSSLFDGREYPWQPAEPTVALFALNVLRLTDDPADRAILLRHFAGQAAALDADEQTLALPGAGEPAAADADVRHGQAAGGSAAASPADPPPGLTAAGRLAYALLTTTDPVTVDALLAQLPPLKRAEIQALSPSAGIARLKARLFIMHDAGDPYVPVTESFRLDQAVPDPAQKYYAHFSLFEHVRPNPGALSRITLVREGFRLTLHIGRLLAALDA